MAKRSVNDYTPEDKRRAKDISELNAQFHDILASQFKSLEGDSFSRKEQQTRMRNRFLGLVQNDVQSANRQKSPNTSTYDYIASALTGQTAGDSKDPKDKVKLRDQLDKLLSAGDSEIASYFMSNGMSNMHIYDEIDSICAYMYQLDEAVDIISEGVLAAEEVSEGISMDIGFEGMNDADTIEYKSSIMNMFRNEGMTRKLKSHIGKKMVKYGISRVMVIPYEEISNKLENLRGGFGVQENVALFEGVEPSDGEYTLESAKQDIATILDIPIPSGKSSAVNQKANEVSPEIQKLYETVCGNLETITVCENNDPPNIMGMDYHKLAGLDGDIVKAIDKAMKESSKDIRGVAPKKGTKEHSEGLVDENSLEGIKGCYQKIVDPRQMKAIKIFDYTLGYYYFENYEYEYTGTTITDMMSNNMVFDQRTQAVDRLVDSVIGKLKYGDVLKGDKQFRNLILNCLMYTERRDNPIRIKFVPVEYVIEFKTNIDENENGRPVLLRSLFFARLYISMLLFYVSAVVTKSTDSEFYYLKESALDPNYENQVTDIMDQLQQCNFDPIAVANGQILNTTKAINKKYFMSMGVSGEKVFDIDVMSGQQIDINNEFLTMLKKMAISSTGVSSLQIDVLDEVEYATLAQMSNIKTAKRCNTIQEDMNPSLTAYAKIVAKYTTNIPPEIIDKLFITLRPNRYTQNNMMATQINDNIGTAESMLKVAYRGDDAGEVSDFDKMVIEKAKRALVMELCVSAPWAKLDSILEDAKIAAKEELSRDSMSKGDSGGGDSESY